MNSFLRMLAIATLWLSAPSSVSADAISPTPPCPPGMARDAGGIGSIGGFYGHGGAPRCQPAVCRDRSTCGAGQVCRSTAHCIESRSARELRPSRGGHSAPFDRDDPESYHDVTRVYDAGQCVEGRCPEGARCLRVSTCRPAHEVDTMPPARLEGPVGGGVAEYAWSVAQPHAASDPADPADSADSAGPEASDVGEALEAEVAEPESPDSEERVREGERSPPPSAAVPSCACRVHHDGALGGAMTTGLLALAFSAWRRRRRGTGHG